MDADLHNPSRLSPFRDRRRINTNKPNRICIMKTQYRKLRLIMRVLKPEWFFNIDVDVDRIRFMGMYNRDTATAISKYIKLVVQPDGLIVGQRNGIKIVLT
jgi:hypothetical protein